MGSEAHFVCQGAPEFNQRAAIVEAVRKVEERRGGALNPLAERLKQKTPQQTMAIIPPTGPVVCAWKI